MRFSHRYPAFLLCAWLASTLACQSAQKQSFAPPVKAQAPALVAGAAPAENTQEEPAAANTDKKASTQAAPAPTSAPVEELIARVETEYKAGQDDYHAGHLEAAKQHFDSAFNQLLGSGLDLQSDTRGDCGRG